MAADLPGSSGPAKDVATCFRTHHFREPRVVEAAVLAGLDFSRLNGASDCLYMGAERINLLDVAVFSAEHNTAHMLQQQGMEPEFLSNPQDELNVLGMHFVELTEQGMLTLRMASIRVAIAVGINLNMFVVDLGIALGPDCDQCVQCWEEDGMRCILKRGAPILPGHHTCNTISLLDTAIMLGRATDACDLVEWGIESCRLNPDDIHHPTPCVFMCSNPMCGAEWPVPIFAAPKERQAATSAAIRCSRRLQLSHLWDQYALPLLQVFHRSYKVVVEILAFSVHAPPMARLGVWHLDQYEIRTTFG